MKTILIIVSASILWASCGHALSESNFDLADSSNAPSQLEHTTQTTEDIKLPENPLESIWLDADNFEINGIAIERKCNADPQNDYLGDCELSIRSRGKLFRRFAIEHGRKYWLQYGLFNFLDSPQKQLVVFTYSGGAHCCYDYTIFDLEPGLRTIYDSTRSDSGNEIGNSLVPVDIDGDGVFEFHRDVMAFDYMGSAGHAGASFPPAIFADDRSSGKFAPATKRFPGFVTEQLREILSDKEEPTDIDPDVLDEIRVRTKFLYMVYAGERDAAWKYFEENYRSQSGNGYQEQFKEQFKKEFAERFSTDPTYLSIYPHP